MATQATSQNFVTGAPPEVTVQNPGLFRMLGSNLSNSWGSAGAGYNQFVQPVADVAGDFLFGGPSQVNAQTTSQPSVTPQTTSTNQSFSTPLITRGKYGTITDIGGGKVYSDPRDNPNYSTASSINSLATGIPKFDTQTGLPLNGSMSNVANKNFNITPSNDPLPSSYLGGDTTLEGLVKMRDERQNSMTNGTDTSLFPSDSLLGKLASAQYNTALYSPEQKQALQNLTDINSRITATNLANRRQIQQLYENGNITKEQASGFITDSQRRADAQMADLAVSQTAASNNVNTLGLYQKNQLDALSGISDYFKPQTVAPGSQLINAFGQQSGQGSGVNPAVASSYASQLFNDDLKTGTQHLTSDGQVDVSYYYQRASQILSGQSGGMNSSGQSSGNSSSGQPGFTGAQGLSPSVQPYVVQGSGGSYINEDKVPISQRDFVKQQAAQNGVAYLTGDDIAKYRNIEVTQSNLDSLQQVVQKVNGSGLMGRTFGAAWNMIQGAAQKNTDISSYNVWRDTAINTIQALAGGSGSGLRLNQAEIDTATGNLPKITDNLETATTKINLVRGFLGKWQAELLHGNINGGNQSTTSSQQGSLYDF